MPSQPADLERARQCSVPSQAARGGNSRHELLQGLNTQQAQAVSLGWGSALIIAGAGSGKTTVLMRRTAYLMSQLRQDPFSIMAATFTNKAAAQMKQRIEHLLPGGLAMRLSIGTFHSICAQILRREIAAYRSSEDMAWTGNFVIYDEVDSLNLVKNVVAGFNLDEKLFVPREVRHNISAQKNEGTTAKRYVESAKGYRQTRIGEIFYAYQRELARNNALDFDDLILMTADLLKQNGEVLGRLQARYKHLLVDEFQDTNKSQYELIRMLMPGGNDWEERSLMVVGDVDQSIYSWRQADYRIILGFQKDFSSSALIKLEENYRSTSTILQAANSVITNNSERIDKVLRCNRDQGNKVDCCIASDEIDEAYFVVQQVKSIAARGQKLSSCAVLYRTNAQSRAIEEILVRNHLPYSMVGATRFYDRQEIKDVIAYLRLIYNGQDGQAFLRAVNQPRRGVGKTTLERLVRHSGQQSLSLLESCGQAASIQGLSPKAAGCLAEFAVQIQRWRKLAAQLPVWSLMEAVLQESGYLNFLEQAAGPDGDPAAQGRVDNLREFLGVAREFEESAPDAGLEAFLTRIALVSDLDAVELDNDTIKLMTIHSAKGLEFDHVFIMGLEDGLFPHFRSLNSPSALEEERRLMYVAVTRAADRLYLSCARRRVQFNGMFTGSTGFTIPSRFLKEIDMDLLKGYYPDPETPESPELPAGEVLKMFEDSSGGQREFDDTYGRIPIRNTAVPRAARRAKDNALLAAVKNDAATAPDASCERLPEGTMISHAKFGNGRITKIIGDPGKELYNVDFEQGGKRLLDPRFVKLLVIQ